MVAKIGRGTKINGILLYNLSKVEKEKGEMILMHHVADNEIGNHTVQQLRHSFEPYLAANRRTEKPVLHISLNPHPRDRVDDETFRKIAEEYMQAMGYGNQPFVVFKHTDVERTHIHIVSVCVDEEGNKISDKFERRRSMRICRELEDKYRLKVSSEKEQLENSMMFHPVDYHKGDIKSQIAAIVRYLPNHYQFQSFGAYNALLSLFNISAEEVSGELHGRQRTGIVYFALDEQGRKCSNPFKASLFGKNAGYAKLQDRFATCKEAMKDSPAKAPLKRRIEAALATSKDENAFRKNLKKHNVDTVARRNKEGRIYGITFIDHETRTVWNGSQLGKHLSANIFHDSWNNGTKPLQENDGMESPAPYLPPANTEEVVLQGVGPAANLISSLFDILTDDSPSFPEDNQPFIRRRKKRKRRKFGSQENQI